MESVKSKVDKFKNLLIRYSSNIKSKKSDLDDSLKISRDELIQDISELLNCDPKDIPRRLIFLFKDIIGSGLWVSYSYYRYLQSLYKADTFSEKLMNNEIHRDIINCVSQGIPLKNEEVSYGDIFNSVFEELKVIDSDPTYCSPLECPTPKITIVLVSGVFNELFKTPAFERGVSNISKETGIKYFVAKTSGIKSSKINSQMVSDEIEKYIMDHPEEKIWLVAFSKGGLDSLHFLKKRSDIANEHIIGLSTIATPLLGSEHTDHKALQVLKKMSDFPLYKLIGQGRDLFAKEFQKSLSNQFQNEWFRRNYKNLPQNIFYTSVGMTSNFTDSHFWMMLTKIIFPSKALNDGIVDLEQTKYPRYFNSINFGSVQGHHLSGQRSSAFNQEAFIKAHIIVLHYLKKF